MFSEKYNLKQTTVYTLQQPLYPFLTQKNEGKEKLRDINKALSYMSTTQKILQYNDDLIFQKDKKFPLANSIFTHAHTTSKDKYDVTLYDIMREWK